MKVVSVAQMQAIDRDAIDGRGIPALQLMENAGRAVARVIAEDREVGGLAVAVVAGSGNNGGDGCVVARELLARGARSVLYLVSPRERMSGDARAMLEAAERAGVAVRDLSTDEQLREQIETLYAADVLVDALLGTGVRGETRGQVRAVLDALTSARGYKVSIDVPSGLCADTGEPLGTAFVPDLTVTLGLAKVGIVGSPGFARVGRLVVADIGFPADIAEARLGEVLKKLLETSGAHTRLAPAKPSIAQRAAEALAKLSRGGTVLSVAPASGALLLVAGYERKEVQLPVLEALGNTRDVAALDTLLALGGNAAKEAEVRLAALKAAQVVLGAMSKADKKVYDTLVALLDDGNENIRQAAAACLSSGPFSAEQIVAVLVDKKVLKKVE